MYLCTCTAGIIYFSDFAAHSVLPPFAHHAAPFYINDANDTIYNGTLVDSIIASSHLYWYQYPSLCTSVCSALSYPSSYIPGMLKRMGLGMISVLLSLVASFTMDTLGHMKGGANTITCMFYLTSLKNGDPISLHSCVYQLLLVCWLSSLSLSLFAPRVLTLWRVCS